MANRDNTSWIESAPSGDVERAVIGSIMQAPESIAMLSERLTPDMFADPFLRSAFDAAVILYKQERPANLLLLAEALTESGDEHARDALLEIVTWMNAVDIWPTWAGFYADRVYRFHRLRAFQAGFTRHWQALTGNGALDPVDVLAEWLNEMETGAIRDDPGPRPIADMIDTVRDTMERRRAGESLETETPLPWQALTNLIGGLRPGEVCVISGRPSSGKSLAAGQILMSAARAGAAIMYSAEMTYDAILERAIACESGIPYDLIHDPTRMTDEQYEEVQFYMDALAALPVYVDDLSGITTDQMLARTQAIQREQPVSAVIFDYLELAGDNPNERSAEQRLSKIIVGMKHLARRLNVPVVVLAQLSREVERRNPPIPKLSDLRYSGMIEQVADKVLMLYRPQYYVQQGMLDPDPALEHVLEIYVHKNRNGRSGRVELHYNGPTFRISDVPEAAYTAPPTGSTYPDYEYPEYPQ